MKLNAKVITAHSASEFTDNRPRVTVKVVEADHMDNKLKLPNADGIALDDELVLLVLTKGDAAELSGELDNLAALAHNNTTRKCAAFLDQLRPDEPVPWERPEKLPSRPLCPLCEGKGVHEYDPPGVYCHVCNGTGEDPRPAPQPTEAQAGTEVVR